MVKIAEKILKVFADNNLFNEGVELIGSWCFQLYQKHLGAINFPLRTQDIDFLIPNPFQGKEHTDFIKQLEELGFSPDFKPDGSLYLWNADFKIEFITPEKGRSVDRAIKIRELGFSAIPLRFVTLLLEDPIMIVESGINIRIPNPSRFCLHKLIISSRRKKIDKKLKDIQQAICTSVIVDNEEINRVFASLPKKWKQSIVNTLAKAKETLPLLIEEITKLEFTLQSNHK